jgi:hypothetical protein
VGVLLVVCDNGLERAFTVTKVFIDCVRNHKKRK